MEKQYPVYWSTGKEIKFLKKLGTYSPYLRRSYVALSNAEYRQMLLSKYISALDHRRVTGNLDLEKIRTAVEGMMK